jgi:hypothetical protein
MKTTRKQVLRQKWMAAFSDEVAKRAPQLAGKIDWDTATHFFFEGMTPAEAAERFGELAPRVFPRWP